MRPCKPIWILFFAPMLLYGGSTGKLTGKVRNAKTQAPIPGVVVMLEGTAYGTTTEADGSYLLLNIPPGTYTVQTRMLGYRNLRIENVRISVDLTRELDIALEETVLDLGESVTVTAQKPMIVKDLTASTAVVGKEELSILPVTEIGEAIELQAGLIKDSGGNLHVRGGRKGEIGFWIDGIPVTDVYDGSTVVEVNKEMVQELQVISGAFNAEYGQAMSGIVNITTKEGTNRWNGAVTWYSGDYLSTHNQIFPHIQSFHPWAVRNGEASAQGPIKKNKLFFSGNIRYYASEGWLFGKRKYNPSAVVREMIVSEDALSTYAPEYAQNAQVYTPGFRIIPYILGTNPYLDSLVTAKELGTLRAANPDTFAYYYNKVRSTHLNGKGDGKYVPMAWNTKLYGQMKLIWRITPDFKMTYNGIYDGVQYSDFERDYFLNPDGSLNRFRTGHSHILQISHALSSRTFYKLGFSYFSKEYKHYAFESPYDPRYVHPYLGLQQPYSFKTGGTSDSRFKRNTTTFLAKWDLESQINPIHLVKTGFEFRKHRMFQENIQLRPVENQTDINLVFDSPYIQTRILPDSTIYTSRYTHEPIEFAGYLQDKIELKQMIVNIGVRLDFFEPDGHVLRDPTDPYIYNPIKPQNRYHDWGTDGLANTHDPDRTEGNGIQDPGEPLVTLAERKAYWFKKASRKIQVSPRLGVSFPITERGVIHFSYGHFFQIPRFERLYQNPDFELGAGTGNVGIIGNADLKPEQTVSGEIGLQQQLSEDVFLSLTGFFRDIRNLAGTTAEEIVIFGGSAKYSKFVNSDFGFVRGVILSLNKQFAQGFSAGMDYTFQIAKGTNSDPEQARNALAGGSLPEVQLLPLDWDQRHTVNLSLAYSSNTWGGSLIAQLGSGLPYTPRRTEDITTLLINNQKKPSTYNVDLRLFRTWRTAFGKLTCFVKVFNLFDTLNEINVYDDTGRAGFTTDEEIARSTNPTETINTLDQWFTNPTHYSEPRRIEFGMTWEF